MPNTITPKDHDLLIRLEAKLDQVIVDVKELKDGTTQRIASLELRVGEVENWIRTQKLNFKWVVTIATAIGAVISFVVSQLVSIYELINKTH